MHYKSQRNLHTTSQRKFKPKSHSPAKKGWTLKPIMKLGEGSFGTVSSAMDVDGTFVAVKAVKIDPNFKNREVEIHSQLDSPYCVKMKSHYTAQKKDGSIVEYIIMEHMPVSLGKYLTQLRLYQETLTPQQIHQFSKHIFKGLDYLHSMNICHRDIKPENILLNPHTNSLKLCDFGSAKVINKGEKNSPNIGSRFYRAPEVLLGCRTYDLSIDIWSAACVIAQMLLNNNVLFAGNDDDDQLREIMKIIGFPSSEDDASFEHEKPFPSIQKVSDLKRVLPTNIDPKLYDLLSSIFQYNPAKRPTALQCLKHPYFQSKQYTRLPTLKVK